MGIQNIFDLTGLNFPVTRDLVPANRVFEADSGFKISELVRPPAVKWEINLLGRKWTDIKQLFDLIHQTGGSSQIFTLNDPEWSRKFTVRIPSGLRIESGLSEFSNSAIILEEAIGEALLEYPSAPTIFFEETDAIQSGTWTSVSSIGRPISGGNSNVLQSTTIGGSLTWTYGGYGLNIWATGTGQIEIFDNGNSLGIVNLVGKVVTAAAFTQLSLPLDVHIIRVDHQAAGTVNLDALEFVYTSPTMV